MRYTRALALLLAIAAPVCAHADTLFSLSASFANGDTATGTLDLDTVSGLVLGGTATLFDSSDSPFATLPVITGPPLQGIQRSRGSFDALIVYNGVNDFLQLDLPTISLVGYGGSAIVIDPHFSNIGVNNQLSQLTSGAFSPATASTPEPSSLLLLGTGMLGLLSAARRRLTS